MLTFEEYQGLGGVCDLTAFNRNIQRVSGLINNATCGRLRKMSEIPQAVKCLCRDLVERFADDVGTSRQISSHSQSAGGVSESESFVIRSTEERSGEIDDMIRDYLMNETDKNGTPLLYRGCTR